MDTKYRLIGRRKRDRVRAIAREKHLCYPDDPKKAIHEAEMAIRHEFTSIVAAILIGLLVKLAVELIWYWVKQQIRQPTVFFTAGEPGSDKE